ncbi:MAG TPA: bifunctional phosphoglucose/phosphomannose isomerase [Actinomycetota bacterium]|nr:bifunctional phosphoglucose/phosphomannose isomerase [Actinomycetota bacterium]
MIDLDDEVAIRASDPGNMIDVVAGLPHHCLEGHRLGLGASPPPVAEGITALAFCGMGGSAVAGDVIAALGAPHLPVPVQVVRSPVLPAYCRTDTLVLVSSYSGNTAEALGCFEEAVRRGCRLAVLTSGGRLAARAHELGLPRVPLPEGFQPRAALGYLALGSLGLLEGLGWLPPMGEDLRLAAGDLTTLAATLGPSVPTSVNPAKRLAVGIGDRVPVIWGAEGIGAVAADRWRTQMNENGKVAAWSSALPELDHNEVVGWSEDQGERFCVIALRHEGDHPDVADRFDLSGQIARSAGARTEEVWARDSSMLGRFLSLVMVGDFTSVYVGVRRGIDPTPIDAIARLKRALSAT